MCACEDAPCCGCDDRYMSGGYGINEAELDDFGDDWDDEEFGDDDGDDDGDGSDESMSALLDDGGRGRYDDEGDGDGDGYDAYDIG